MKACSIRSLTAPCIDRFGTITHLHVIISVQSTSSKTLQPLDNMAKPLCDGKQRETRRKLARATGAVIVNTVEPPRLESGCLVSVGCMHVHIHLLLALLHSSRWCAFFSSPSSTSAGPSATLLGFNETLLLMTPELHFGVTGVTALVAELHGGPVVVCASL